uniref:GCR125 n=1 Tax=Schmidtea mediterranea TaxID=79327 RepID=A0A193KUD2_SCHMD|nr:GCR125 [Schmidtea mediterranea]
MNDTMEYSSWINMKLYFFIWFIPLITTIGFFGNSFVLYILLYKHIRFPPFCFWLRCTCIGNMVIVIQQGVFLILYLCFYPKQVIGIDLRIFDSIICKFFMFVHEFSYSWTTGSLATLYLVKIIIIVTQSNEIDNSKNNFKICLILSFLMLTYSMLWPIIYDVRLKNGLNICTPKSDFLFLLEGQARFVYQSFVIVGIITGANCYLVYFLCHTSKVVQKIQRSDSFSIGSKESRLTAKLAKINKIIYFIIFVNFLWIVCNVPFMSYSFIVNMYDEKNSFYYFFSSFYMPLYYGFMVSSYFYNCLSWIIYIYTCSSLRRHMRITTYGFFVRFGLYEAYFIEKIKSEIFNNSSEIEKQTNSSDVTVEVGK